MEGESRRIVQINGQPGVVAYVDGHARVVVSVDVKDGLISGVYIVTTRRSCTVSPTFTQ